MFSCLILCISFDSFKAMMISLAITLREGTYTIHYKVYACKHFIVPNPLNFLMNELRSTPGTNRSVKKHSKCGSAIGVYRVHTTQYFNITLVFASAVGIGVRECTFIDNFENNRTRRRILINF